MYVFGVSKGYQPVIVINVRRLINENKLVDNLQDATMYFFDWIINNMLIPGHVEQWTCIMDFKDVGIT